MGEFLKTKFDNLCLFALIVLMIFVALHMAHHNVDQALESWFEQGFTTVLGAYIGLTQSHRIATALNGNGKNGGNGNGTPPSSSSSPAAPVSASH